MRYERDAETTQCPHQASTSHGWEVAVNRGRNLASSYTPSKQLHCSMFKVQEPVPKNNNNLLLGFQTSVSRWLESRRYFTGRIKSSFHSKGALAYPSTHISSPFQGSKCVFLLFNLWSIKPQIHQRSTSHAEAWRDVSPHGRPADEVYYHFHNLSWNR